MGFWVQKCCSSKMREEQPFALPYPANANARMKKEKNRQKGEKQRNVTLATFGKRKERR